MSHTGISAEGRVLQEGWSEQGPESSCCVGGIAIGSVSRASGRRAEELPSLGSFWPFAMTLICMATWKGKLLWRF